MYTAAIVCCFFMFGCHESPTQEQKAEYAVLTLSTADRELLSSYPASIQGRQDIAIYPQVAGTISQVCIKEGECVRKGQTLFIIDQVPYEAALKMAQANVEAAQAGVATAQLVYDSKKELFEGEVVSDFDLHTAKNQLLTAQAQLSQAQAQEVTARNNFSYTTVQSPSDGVVGTLPFRAGTLVSPSLSKPLTTVSDNSEIYVYFSITENQLLELTSKHGSMKEVLASLPKVKLQLNNGSIYSEGGYIETISGVIDSSTGSVSLRAVFPNAGGLLHSGASGNILLPREMKECLVIPCSATFEIQDKIFVYKVIDGKATSVPISVILVEGGREYIVTSGLNMGDKIISEGVGMLREGMPVVAKKNEKEE